MGELVAGELLHHGRQLGARGHERGDQVAALGNVLGVAAREDDVGFREHEAVVALGDAHHLTDDLERQANRNLGDEVARALVENPVDDALAHQLDVAHDLLEDAW